MSFCILQTSNGDPSACVCHGSGVASRGSGEGRKWRGVRSRGCASIRTHWRVCLHFSTTHPYLTTALIGLNPASSRRSFVSGCRKRVKPYSPSSLYTHSALVATVALSASIFLLQPGADAAIEMQQRDAKIFNKKGKPAPKVPPKRR